MEENNNNHQNKYSSSALIERIKQIFHIKEPAGINERDSLRQVLYRLYLEDMEEY